MQVALSKMVKLLDPGKPLEVRHAAVTVLGELGQRGDEVSAAILAALEDEDAELRLRAIGAVGKLRIERALPLLGERLKGGGPEAERAAEVLARFGSKGSRLLHELMPRVAPGLRRYIARALAGAGAAGGGDVSELEILLDKDPAVVGAAVQSLAAAIPNLDARRQKVVADELIRLAGGKTTVLSPATEAGVIRLAGLLDDERVASLLWDRILPPHAPEARASALAALGKWVGAPTKEQRERLFFCASAADFRIAAPALTILDRLPVNDKIVPEWLALFRAPDLAARRLALSKVGDRDSPAVAEALLGQVGHPDRAYREEVLDRLSRTASGRKSLAKRLSLAETADHAWTLARALARFALSAPEAWADELFPQAAAYLEAGDRRADALLFVLREGNTAGVRDRLENRARALLEKKEYEKAHLVYRALARDPAAGFSYRLSVALCGLKVSPRDLAAEARTHDPCLGQFGELVRQDAATVLVELQKTPWLGAEELYYLGFHFTEIPDEAQRSFGGAVLQLLLKRFPRNKLTSAATKKLDSAGLSGKKGKRK